MEKYIVELTKLERENLIVLTKDIKSAKYMVQHANILLETDKGNHADIDPIKSDKEIAKMFRSSEKTVLRIRQQFVEEGLERALLRKRNSGTRPRILSGDEEAQLITICCSTPPTGRVRWTLNLLADRLIELKIVEEISRSTVHRTLNQNELKPWQKKEWCIPPESNAEFVCNMEDVLDTYKKPYDRNRPVVCMDELNKPLIGEVRRSIPMSPGQPERYDTEYSRNGTCNIFMASEPLTGKRQVKVTDRRTKIDWADFIKELVDVHYPNVDKILLVMDNLNTHTGSALYEAFHPQEAKRILDKLEIHYTPKHGSWLNMAEIELSHLSRQCLDRRIPEKEVIINEVNAWCKMRNEENSIVNWQFTTNDARIKLKRLYPVHLPG